MIDINLWTQVLTKPVETFRNHKKTDMATAFWSIVISGVIAGAIASLYNLSIVLYFGGIEWIVYRGPFIFNIFAPLITVPVYAVIGWLIFSWVVDFIAKSSKKKSNFEEVASLIAVILPPIMVLSSVMIWIPFVGFLLRTLVVLYALYLVALALNGYHQLWYNLGMGSGKKK